MKKQVSEISEMMLSKVLRIKGLTFLPLSDFKSSLPITYYIVEGYIEVPRLKSGFRKLLFYDAVECHAHHDYRMGPEACSIYYKDASDNKLYFSLLFDEPSNSHIFRNKSYSYSNKKIIVQLNRDLKTIESTGTIAKYIYIDDYKKANMYSPTNVPTPLSIIDYEFANLPNDQVRNLRSFENLSLIPDKECVLKCHIVPTQFYQGSCENDPDNVLWGSYSFWCCFNGDSQRKPYYADWDWGQTPNLWIDFVKAETNAIVVEGIAYHQIFVNIMFWDIDIANEMRSRWKPGTEDIGDTGFYTSFFATDVLKVQKYLRIKKNETRIRVGMKEDMVTRLTPLFEEAEAAELEDYDVVDIDDVNY